MGCWKWFDNILKSAGTEITDENRERIDEIIHEFIDEQSSYARCSSNWRKAQKEIESNEELRRMLIERLESLKWIDM